MADSFMGQIIMFAGTFSIDGFTFCSGQIVGINQYTALYSLVGTFYGGDGRVSFGIPDLRGRSPIGLGQGPGLTNFYQIGLFGGLEHYTLAESQMPIHSHGITGTSGTPATGTLSVQNSAGTQNLPDADCYIAASSDTSNKTFYKPGGFAPPPNFVSIQGLDVSGGGGTIPSTTDPNGGSQAFPLRDPYLVITFQISLTGIYPSRN